MMQSEVEYQRSITTCRFVVKSGEKWGATVSNWETCHESIRLVIGELRKPSGCEGFRNQVKWHDYHSVNRDIQSLRVDSRAPCGSVWLLMLQQQLNRKPEVPN